MHPANRHLLHTQRQYYSWLNIAVILNYILSVNILRCNGNIVRGIAFLLESS